MLSPLRKELGSKWTDHMMDHLVVNENVLREVCLRPDAKGFAADIDPCVIPIAKATIRKWSKDFFISRKGGYESPELRLLSVMAMRGHFSRYKVIIPTRAFEAGSIWGCATSTWTFRTRKGVRGIDISLPVHLAFDFWSIDRYANPEILGFECLKC